MRLFALALVVVGLSLAGVSGAQNVVPVANAGPDIAIDCAGQNGTTLAMNGTGSSVGDGFTYRWSGVPAAGFNHPTTLWTLGTFPVGTTEVTLTVTYTDPATGVQTSAADTMQVDVNDPTPPVVGACADPELLWPPNHKLQDVHVELHVFDACDASPEVELVSISSNEPDDGTGDGNTGEDIQGAEIGTDDRDFALRAERSGPGDGRVYSAEYSVWDLAENRSDATALVVVPHDMRNGTVSDDNACRETDRQIKKATRAAKRVEKAQVKAAKKAAKANLKAYKAALRAARQAAR